MLQPGSQEAGEEGQEKDCSSKETQAKAGKEGTMNLIRLKRVTIGGFQGSGDEQMRIYDIEKDVYINPRHIVHVEQGKDSWKLRLSNGITDNVVTEVYLSTGEVLTVVEHPMTITKKIDEVQIRVSFYGER